MKKTNVLFVCLGNVCRSPMAEAIFKKLAKEQGVSGQYEISSAATSTEEMGNQPQPGAIAEMQKHGLRCQGMISTPITQQDINQADYIITMDRSNMADLQRIIPKKQLKKLHLCMDIVPGKEGISIADPWYTNRFGDTYQMLAESLPLWLEEMQKGGTAFGQS